MKVILITLYKRPAYTQRLLEALAQCYGIERYSILVSADRYAENPALTEQCVEMASRFKSANAVRIVVHNPKLGIDLNKLWSFPEAFKEGNFVIHLEDDIVPARDFLRYMEWVDENFREHSKVLAGVAYANIAPLDPDATPTETLYETYPSGGFCCWGWATWEDRWRRVIGDESAYRAYAQDQLNDKFDWFWKQYGEDHGLKVIVPTIPRVQMIGKQDSVHMTDELFQEHYNPWGAWNVPDLPDPFKGDWYVREGWRLT